MWRKGLLVAFVAALVACGDTGPAGPPDETPTPTDAYTLVFYYAAPADFDSRFDVLQDSINESIKLVDDYLFDLTGKRFRTTGQVAELEVPWTNAESHAGEPVALLHNLLDLPEKTLAYVYYDGTHYRECGGGGYPPSLPLQVGASYLRAELPEGAVRTCATMSFLKWWQSPSGSGTSWLTPRGYREFAMMHEVFHLFGIVPAGTPGSSGGHLIDTRRDVMSSAWDYNAYMKIDERYRPALLDSPWLR